MHKRQESDSYGDDMDYAPDSTEGEHEMSPPMDDTANDNFRVAIRVRPPVPRELEGPRPFINVVRIPNEKSITLCEHLDTEDGRGGVYSTQTYTFDHVYGPPATQQDVYEHSAQSAVHSVLQGYNATLIAYGQTGTGKTFTMEGFTGDEQRGLIPRATEEVFSYIHSCRMKNMKFLVRASYLQIYNEAMSDLLKPLNKQLTVRHTKERGVYVDGLSEYIVRSPNDVYVLMEKGCSLRATGSTKMSELSSRSHAMFTIIVEIMEGEEQAPHSYKYGKLNIVDLAGSEKVRQAAVSGTRLQETKKINWSLHELGNVIAALTDPKRKDKHVPFRNSCLTRALRDSLGGNCKTTLIACISPALESYSESLSTLKFANRAKNIKNDAVINEDVDQATLLRRYERELARLRHLVETNSAGLITELQMGKRRAEEDREAALEALRALQGESDDKQRLTERIMELENMIGTGVRSDGPEFATKLDELDKERQVIEEDKAQVDRYKQLLLKQRDIMLNLTTRLNERDETILQLQEEIDAYDAHVQMLEEAMEVSAPTMTNRADATEYLASLRTIQDGETFYQAEGNGEHLLSPHEKIVELLMLKGRGATPTADQSFDRSDEKRSMEIMLRDRVEVAVNREISDRAIAMNSELEMLKTKLAASEEKRRALEYTLELSRVSGDNTELNERMKRYMEHEQEALKAPFNMRIVGLQHELDAERDQRRRLAKELDKWRFELSQARSYVPSGKREEIEVLWQHIQDIEEDLHSNLPKASPTMASGTNRHTDPFPTSNELQLEEQKKQHETVQHELTRQLDERGRRINQLEMQLREYSKSGSTQNVGGLEKEITQLRKALNTQMKDRKALKTIMESRIKVKVDTIGDLVGGQNFSRASVEVRALQNLVDASIAAMEHDD